MQLLLLVINALAIRFVRRLGQCVSVDGHMMLRIRFIHERSGVDRAQLLRSLYAVARFQLRAGLQRIRKASERVRRFDRCDGRTLHHRAAEQSLCKRRRADRADACRARGLARERHVVRIAAERRDVLLHPFERLDLIQKPVIAGRAVLGFGLQRFIREISEYAEPVAEIDDQYALLRKTGSRIVGVPRLSRLQRAAVDDESHSQQAIIMELSCEESCCSAGNNQAAEQAGITQHSWQLSSR